MRVCVSVARGCTGCHRSLLVSPTLAEVTRAVQAAEENAPAVLVLVDVERRLHISRGNNDRCACDGRSTGADRRRDRDAPDWSRLVTAQVCVPGFKVAVLATSSVPLLFFSPRAMHGVHTVEFGPLGAHGVRALLDLMLCRGAGHSVSRLAMTRACLDLRGKRASVVADVVDMAGFLAAQDAGVGGSLDVLLWAKQSHPVRIQDRHLHEASNHHQ